MSDESVLVAEKDTATLPGPRVIIADGNWHFPLRTPDESEADVSFVARKQLGPAVGCGRDAEDYRVTSQPRFAPWLIACDRRLEDLLKLERDWNSYGAEPPNNLAVSLARKVVRVLSQQGLPAPCVNPSAEEGVCVSFGAGRLYADFECFNSGEILAATSDGEGQRRVWEVGSQESDIIEAAHLIRTFLNSWDS